jgi:hypothetical protein
VNSSPKPTADARANSLRLSAVEAVDFAADLASRRATAMTDAGQFDEAIAVYDQEAHTYRAMLGGGPGRGPDPAIARRQSLHLGKVLMEIGTLHARMRRSEPALAATAEALAVVRALGPIDSVMSGYVLARVLWGYGWVRSGLGVDLREALAAVGEAESIMRQLAQDPPSAIEHTVRAELPALQAFHAHLRTRSGVV